MGHNSGDGATFISTAIAIDKDKNSPHAVRWAIENLLKKNSSVFLVHVRTHVSQSRMFFILIYFIHLHTTMHVFVLHDMHFLLSDRESIDKASFAFRLK